VRSSLPVRETPLALFQLICVALAIPVLLGLAFAFGYRQFGVLRRLREGSEQPAKEQRELRHQAYRRLVSCGLLALLAWLLAGAQLFLEERADQFIDAQNARPPEANAPEPTPEQRDFLRLYGAYWIVCLVVLMTIVALAGVDLWATRQHGLRERRKLLDDHRILLRRQLLRYRRERGADG
jgi:hypothetical protein